MNEAEWFGLNAAHQRHLDKLILGELSKAYGRPPGPRESTGPKVTRPAVHRTGKALGFRSWKLEGYQLKSANECFGGWKIGEPTRAACRHWGGMYLRLTGGKPEAPVNTDHDAPHSDCHCGLYALHSPEFMSRWHGHEQNMVHGAVLGWGRLQVHHEGWRAEYAQPVMLAFDGERQTYNHCERVKTMGDELGLPVVEWAEFEAEARKLGERVPEDLRPEAASRQAGGYWVPPSFVEQEWRIKPLGFTYTWGGGMEE